MIVTLCIVCFTLVLLVVFVDICMVLSCVIFLFTASSLIVLFVTLELCIMLLVIFYFVFCYLASNDRYILVIVCAFPFVTRRTIFTGLVGFLFLSLVVCRLVVVAHSFVLLVCSCIVYSYDSTDFMVTCCSNHCCLSLFYLCTRTCCFTTLSHPSLLRSICY